MKIEFKVPPSGCLYIVSGGRSWNTDSVDQCCCAARVSAGALRFRTLRGQLPSLRPRVLSDSLPFPLFASCEVPGGSLPEMMSRFANGGCVRCERAGTGKLVHHDCWGEPNVNLSAPHAGSWSPTSDRSAKTKRAPLEPGQGARQTFGTSSLPSPGTGESAGDTPVPVLVRVSLGLPGTEGSSWFHPAGVLGTCWEGSGRDMHMQYIPQLRARVNIPH